jgi:hypothetical protein
VAINLGGIALPDGLVWEDELAWDPTVQVVQHTLDGALVVEEATRLAGRPVTLRGGRRWAWITRAQVLALQALLATPGVTLTLTLHDARSLSVTPRRDDDRGALSVEPLPVVADSGPADPGDTTKYWLDAIRLMEV